jgi:hypothetical protein
VDADVFNWSDRHAPATDYGAREHLLCKLLERWLDNPVKRQTFRMMFQANLEGYSLEELARMYLKTPDAILARIQKLRNALGPKVALMDRPNAVTVVLAARARGGSWHWSSASGGAWQRFAAVPRRSSFRGRGR